MDRTAHLLGRHSRASEASLVREVKGAWGLSGGRAAAVSAWLASTGRRGSHRDEDVLLRWSEGGVVATVGAFHHLFAGEGPPDDSPEADPAAAGSPAAQD